MINLISITIFLLLGIVLKQTKTVGDNAHLQLNKFILYVSLPAVTLYYVPQIHFTLALLQVVSVAWIVYAVALVVFIITGLIFHWDKVTIGCITLCCGLGNTSFIGFPLIKALYGEDGLKTAILVDQPGSFVVLSTLGVITAIYCGSGKLTTGLLLRKLFTFPPLLAFLTAIALNIFTISLPEWINTPMHLISYSLAPLALLAVGMQLNFKLPKYEYKELYVGLLYKLTLAPLIIFSLFTIAYHQQGLTMKVSVMEAATAPMITGAILASQYQLRPTLASLFVGIGIPLSFATLAIWYLLIS